MKSSNFICTIGPSNNSTERIERMIYKGMSVARLNLSHGTLEEHQSAIQNLRLAAERCEERTKFYCPLAIAADIRGPEIRIGKVEKTLVKLQGQVKLNENPNFAGESSSDMIHVDHPLAGKLKRNSKIFIGDGAIGLNVEEIFGDIITCRAFKGGMLASFQSVVIPELQRQLDLPIISLRDKIALQFAVEQGVDFIFASHVESAEQVDEVRDFLGAEGKEMQIYAKIQNQLGVERIEQIVGNADGIVIAPTMNLEHESIPYIQRMLLSLCNQKRKPCLMTVESELIAAEIYQAGNWLLESGHGTVITREASEGKFNPLESMTMLKHVHTLADALFGRGETNFIESSDIDGALVSACVTSSILTTASAIIVTSDKLANFVNNFYPLCEIIAVTHNKKKARQLNIWDKLIPLLLNDKVKNNISKFDFAIKFAKLRGIIKSGDTVVFLKEQSMEVHYVPYDSYET